MNKYLELQDKLCQAMEMFAENAINKAGFDRTIQATIISCVDESIGRYKVQYQDSIFYAYAQNDENKYSSGTGVYVLIQNNDMARDKFIIGTVDKLGMDYLSITDESDRYEKIGTNCLNFPNEIQLCSYLKEDSYLINTNSDYIQNNELLTYIKDAECLLIQMDIQTALDQIQRRKGDYGLEIELIFKNELNENANNIIRKYIVNINQMTGNPYLYIDKTPQLFAISIDNENFLGIKSIKAFSKDFPKEKDEMPKDIFFSNLAVYAANRLDESELNTSRLTIHSPLGLVFSDKVPKLNIEAVARTGNEVTTGMDYYWFVEDASVTSQSDDFLIFGGQGWKCLNFYDIIETEDEEVKEWKPDINTKVFNIDNQLAKQVKYKCVAVKGEEILNKEFILYNSLAQYEIELISDKGTTFYNGVGSSVLTCKVTKDDILSTDCSYVWTYIDKNNILTLMSNIDSNITVNISSIDDFNIYQCSVYKNNFFIGSAEITLLNKKGTEGTYNLVINNGTQTFVYNEDGVSPASSNIVNPITILPLSFTLFDNNGQSFDEDILATLDFSWKIPAENTLLQATGGELIDGYYYFKGADYLQLNYKIASAYSINKTNNQIELNLTYKNLRLRATTNFIFIKEGEIGTNGTGVVAAIQAIGLKDGEEPMTYRFASATNKNYSNLHFNLFSNEDEGTWLSVSEKSTNSNMAWNILRNKYSSTKSDSTNLTYTANSGFTQPQYLTSGYPANVIAVEAKYNNKKYFTTLPMITGMINSSSYPYILYLKRGTGFRTVMYAADGTNPKYSTAEPFEVGLRKTDGTEIDISGSEYTFTWTIKGTDDGSNLATYLTKINTELNKNQFKCRPSEKYDGRSVSIAIECIVYRSGSIISRIYIPIYFYLNTYGYDELNDWNGNSIEINNDGGYILTPQVGAGIKNADNTFTGLLMGQIKLSSSTNEKIGLIGLYNGAQTIFLDSQTGKAEFGKAGAGQIILDPTTNQAIIKSGNFSTANKTGMQINLTEPSITFGSGKFNISSDGILTATNVNLTGMITAESGFLGGWSVSESGITYDSTNYTVHVLTGTNANKDFLVVHDKTTNAWPFFVRADGTFTATKASITGTISATSGTIGGITLNKNYGLYTNNKTTANSTNSGFLIHKDGHIYLGAYNTTLQKCPFQVTNTGTVFAYNGKFIQGTFENINIQTAKIQDAKMYNGTIINDLLLSVDDYNDYNTSQIFTVLDGRWGQDFETPDGTALGGQVAFGILNKDNNGDITDDTRPKIHFAYGESYGMTSDGTIVPIPFSGIRIGVTSESGIYEQDAGITNIILASGNDAESGWFTNIDMDFISIYMDATHFIRFDVNGGFDYSTATNKEITAYEDYIENVLEYEGALEIWSSLDKPYSEVRSRVIYETTTDREPNVYIATGGTNNSNGKRGMFHRHQASSSKRYKHDIKNLNLNEIYGLYDVPVRTFKYNEGYLSKDSERYNKDIPGFIAEEVEEINPILVDHLEDTGETEMWNTKIMIPCLLKLIQHNHEEINDLKQQVKQLQAKLDNI